MKKLLVFVFLSLFCLKLESAELALRHGKIYTMDAARSWAESVAIDHGKIVYVGPDAGIKSFIASDTQTIELQGRLVLPGFIDSHVHPVEAGVGLGQCNLYDKEKKEDVLAEIKKYAESHKTAKWVLGSGWQLPVFPNANPQKEWLDEVVPDRPALIWSADGHSVWANSKALQAAGITKSTPDPKNGRIEKNAAGEPSGTLREDAGDLVSKMAPKPTLEENVAGLKQALAEMNRLGITGFMEANAHEDILKTYAESEKRGTLTARVAICMHADPEGTIPKVLEQVQKFKQWREQYHGEFYKADAIKFFADGVIEANTA
ncbi:MAG: amidohydrolase, partial [Acidobacteria bacterium]